MSASDPGFNVKLAAALDDVAYLEIFSPPPKTRKMMTTRLRKLLQNSSHVESLASTIHEYGFDYVLREATKLAKTEFDARKQARREEAAKQQQLENERQAAEQVQQSDMTTTETALVKVSPKQPLLDGEPDDERTPAISLPFIIQHRTLLALQSGMEHACFTWAEKNLPSLLEERNWDCPEAAALPTWVSEFEKRAASLIPRIPEYSRTVLLVHKAATERGDLSAKTLQLYIGAAILFVSQLDDDVHVHKFYRMDGMILAETEQLERSSRLHLVALAETKAAIAVKRAALDAEEAAAVQRAKEGMAQDREKMVSEFREAAVRGNVTNHDMDDGARDDGTGGGVDILENWDSVVKTE